MNDASSDVGGCRTPPASPQRESLALDGPDIDKVAADWLYPRAKDVATAGKPSLYSTMFSTPDDVQAVLKYYARKLRVPPGNIADPAGALAANAGTDEGGGSYVIVKTTSSTTDGVEEVVFTHKSKSTLTTLIVHRVRDANRTRVTITHAELGG